MSFTMSCRICLAENVRMHTVADKHLQEVFEKLTNIPFVNNDRRPNQACFFCYAKLKRCWHFMMKCLESEKVFSQTFDNNYEQNPLVTSREYDVFASFVKSRMEHINIVEPQVVSNRQQMPIVFEADENFQNIEVRNDHYNKAMPVPIIQTVQDGQFCFITIPEYQEKQTRMENLIISQKSWLSSQQRNDESQERPEIQIEASQSSNATATNTETEEPPEQQPEEDNATAADTFDDATQYCMQFDTHVPKEPTVSSTRIADAPNVNCDPNSDSEFVFDNTGTAATDDYNNDPSPTPSAPTVEDNSTSMPVENTNDNTEPHTDTEKIMNKIDTMSVDIRSLTVNQQLMFNSQARMLEKLTDISRQFNEFMKSPPTTGIYFDNTFFQQITDVNAFQDFEEKLKDPNFAQEVKTKLSLICNKGKGRGRNNAYKLIDMMFSRNVIAQCSWSGGTRTSPKTCFKSFTLTINLFFTLVNESDPLFTLQQCEKFLRDIMRRSTTRSKSKLQRASTERIRNKRMISSNSVRDKVEENSNNEDIVKIEEIEICTDSTSTVMTEETVQSQEQNEST